MNTNGTLILLLALLAGGSCSKKSPAPARPAPPAPPVPKPLDKDSDMLIKANGHWEWEKSVLAFGHQVKPADVGYTRQLIFKADGQVYIHHNNQLVMEPTYQVSNNQGVICVGIMRPFVQYNGETDSKLRNNSFRSYHISVPPESIGTDTLMKLTGDGVCVDRAVTEYYRWQHR